jgi:2-methylisocitrate lyase-like PEP mutase family enzyme
MENKFEEFLALHKGTEPLLVGNVWNAQSAKAFEQQNFTAIGTSSAAVAETLGYADGEEMSLDAYMFIIERIIASTALPLTVDLEGGYGKTPAEISHNISKLYNIGVSGINMEDSVVSNGKRSIVDAEFFSEKLKEIIKLLKAQNIRMFINVRCDSFLLGVPNALEDALSRLSLYQRAGADGLFFPCISTIADITKITVSTDLPVNVMCIPGLPDFKQLKNAGVKRISMGPFLNKNVYQNLKTSIGKIQNDESFNSVFQSR